MSYRGDDFDLRLPPGGSGSTRGPYGDPDRPSDANGSRYRVKAHSPNQSAPLWVDDEMLAVCNAAHEVAQALHSPEVLLQHLVHGMTRVDTAARVLESHGINISSLRRDVTALITAHALRTPDSVDQPVTSSEFKAALRIAGDAAARRDGRAITTSDVLEVLLSYDNEHPGVQVLLSHVRRSERQDVIPFDNSFEDLGHFDALPERSYTDPAMIHVAPLHILDRNDFTPASAPEPHSEALEHVMARLALMDNNYRSETRAVEAERKALSDLMRQLHGDVTKHRSETVHLRDQLGERLNKIERITAATQARPESTTTVLARLQALETHITSHRSETAQLREGLNGQAETVERATLAIRTESSQLRESLTDQLQMIERTALSNRGTSDSTAPVLARLQGLERMIEGRLEDVSKRSEGLGDQITAMETAISHQARETSQVREFSAGEFKQLSHQFSKLNIEVPDFEEALGGRLDTIETMLLDRDTDAGPGLSDDQMGHLELMLENHNRQIAASMAERERNWAGVTDRLNKLEHMLAKQSEAASNAIGERQRLFGAMNERLAKLDQVFEAQQQVALSGGGDHGELIPVLNAKLAQLEQVLTRQSLGTSETVSKLTAIERQMGQSQGQGRGVGPEQMVEIKTLMERVSNAQQTTATVFDQWRLDMSGDMGVLANRLEDLERTMMKPAAQLDNIGADIRNMHIATVEKTRAQLNRPAIGGFWNWLFGPR